MLKAKGSSVLDADNGEQLAVVVPSNCSMREARRWAQYIVDRVNADERGNSARSAPEPSASPSCPPCQLELGGKRCDGCGFGTETKSNEGHDANGSTVVPKGRFWRGEINRFYCKNCGGHYDAHNHTDEASLCPSL